MLLGCDHAGSWRWFVRCRWNAFGIALQSRSLVSLSRSIGGGIPIGASRTVNNAQFELVEVIQLGPGTRLQRTVQQTGIVMVVATVCRTQFRLWYGSTRVAGLHHVMAILGEALTIVVFFYVKVDRDPAADLGPVPVFLWSCTQVQDRREATYWPCPGTNAHASKSTSKPAPPPPLPSCARACVARACPCHDPSGQHGLPAARGALCEVGAGKGRPRVEGPREEAGRESHFGLRAPMPLPPGTRPAPLPVDAVPWCGLRRRCARERKTKLRWRCRSWQLRQTRPSTPPLSLSSCGTPWRRRRRSRRS